MKTSVLNGQSHAVKLLEDLQGRTEADVRRKSEAYRKFLLTAPGLWNRQTLENSHQLRIVELESELTESELKRLRLESRLDLIKDSFAGDNREGISDVERMALVDDLHVARLELLVSVKGDVLTEFLRKQYPERQEMASAEFRDLMVLVREAETLRLHLGKNHPKVRESSVDLQTLKAALEAHAQDTDASDAPLTPQEMIRAYQVLLENDLTDVVRQVEYLRSAVAKEESLARKLLDVSIEGELLQEDYQRSSEVYGAILQKVREQSLVNDFGEYSTEVLADPDVAQMVWPRSKVMMAVGLVFGMILGIMLAIAIDLVSIFRHSPQADQTGVIDSGALEAGLAEAGILEAGLPESGSSESGLPKGIER